MEEDIKIWSLLHDLEDAIYEELNQIFCSEEIESLTKEWWHLV